MYPLFTDFDAEEYEDEYDDEDDSEDMSDICYANDDDDDFTCSTNNIDDFYKEDWGYYLDNADGYVWEAMTADLQDSYERRMQENGFE